jgi:dephospho-CoA kinase
MLVIGLTGGIGTGKSAVADAFAALGAPIIDTDRISRELVGPGTTALRAIAEHFGSEVLSPQGTLDRSALRERIFEEPPERAWLEQLLHPLIRAEVQRRLAAQEAPYGIVVVPLLFESGFDSLVDRVLVVDAPADAQIARVLQRDAMTRSQVEAVIEAQMPRQTRLQRADDVIVNDRDLESLRAAVEALDARYRELAAGAD